MARDSNSPGLPTTTILVLLVGAFALLAYNKIQLQDTRPEDKSVPTSWQSPDSAQDVEAQSWEDPLASVARFRQANPTADNSSIHTFEALRSHLDALRMKPRVFILGVFLSGARSVAGVETRRRARYAVLAGLHRAGFVPDNPDHVGYFLSPNASGSRQIAVFESLVEQGATGSSDVVMLLWLNQDDFRTQPLANFAVIVRRLTGNLDASSAIIGPSDSEGLRDQHAIPYICSAAFAAIGRGAQSQRHRMAGGLQESSAGP
jgi:hypothetical protein